MNSFHTFSHPAESPAKVLRMVMAGHRDLLSNAWPIVVARVWAALLGHENWRQILKDVAYESDCAKLWLCCNRDRCLVDAR